MEFKIIVDSCCDLTPELADHIGATIIPLTMRLGEKEYLDDESLKLMDFMAEMTSCKQKVSSAAPPPLAYREAMEKAGRAFVITLSSQLSGSYANAMLGKADAEKNGISEVHVFDSKSASAGEVLIALKMHDLIKRGLPKEQIIRAINSFIDNMKTYFVLEQFDNLLKNGRLSRVTETIATILNIKLIMGADGEGHIALFAKPRGTKQMLEKMISLIRNSNKPTAGERAVIAHCNNPGLAKQLSALISKHFDFQEIVIVPTKGAISLYADDKGVVLAF